MDQSSSNKHQDEPQPQITAVTLEEIEKRENAATQVACCIWNFE